MAKRQSISVSVTEHQAAFVADCVRSGRWQTTSEVMRTALTLLEHEEAVKRAEIERARGLIRDGAEQLADGRTVDDDRFFGEWDDELAALEGAQHGVSG